MIEIQKNTNKLIKVAVNLLSTFVSQNNMEIDVETCQKTNLTEFLRKFYAGIRTKKGDIYAKRTMLSMRYGLQRHFLKSRELDIVNDDAFRKANEVFFAMCS